MSVRKFLGGGVVGLGRRLAGPPNPRPQCLPRPTLRGRSRVNLRLELEIDDEVVSVIESDGSRTPIFPSERVGGRAGASAGRLRTAIITVMQDLEPLDNGVC